jgi:hypothetical protein
MHPVTYDIKEFQTKQQAIEHGYSETMTDEEASELSSMNRHQRRAWLAQQRRAGKR